MWYAGSIHIEEYDVVNPSLGDIIWQWVVPQGYIAIILHHRCYLTAGASPRINVELIGEFDQWLMSRQSTESDANNWARNYFPIPLEQGWQILLIISGTGAPTRAQGFIAIQLIPRTEEP